MGELAQQAIGRLREFGRNFVAKLSQIIPIHEYPYWIAAIVVGFVSVLYSVIFRKAEILSREVLVESPYWMFFLTPGCFLLGSWLVRYLCPEAQGSGIPQVMAGLDGLKRRGVERFLNDGFGIKSVLVKISSSIITIFGGGAIGREGPTVQVSAAIFHMIGMRAKRWDRHISPDVWLVAGGASGVAAAFNTPLGGLVFAIEELAGNNFQKLKTSLISAVIIAGIASQWVVGSYLYLGFPRVGAVSISVVPWAFLIGALGGVLGALFGRAVFFFTSLRKRFLTESWWFLFPIVAGLIVASIAVWGPANGVGSGRETMVDLLFRENGTHGDVTLLAARFFAPVFTYVSGVAGGIFAPSLAAGGALGSFLTILTGGAYHNLFVLLGMIAFLTGVTRSPFTSFVLVLEMTDRHSAIFPMMLAALMATLGAILVDKKSFYERVKEFYLENIQLGEKIV